MINRNHNMIMAMKVIKDTLLKLVLMLSVVFVVSCEEYLPDGELFAKEYLPSGELRGHAYVDLGLPSGVKWATCNVGASSPEEYGGYYAWGETEEKEDYSWSTYKWFSGNIYSNYTFTKYNTNTSMDVVDNKTVLEPEDDVAHVKWGGSWRMPTLDEQKELLDNCTWSRTTQNGVDGYKVTGSNGNSIFLPAAGNSGSNGRYWSSSLYSSDSHNAYYLYFISSGSCGWSYDFRGYGLTVRPVCGGVKYTVSVSKGDGGSVKIKSGNGLSIAFEKYSTVTVVAKPNEGYAFSGWYVGDALVSSDAEYTFTVCEDVALVAKFKKLEINGHAYVDLGLPSGVKWATCNVGASSPEEYGGYYAWGETERKADFTWNSYKWCNGDEYSMSKYCINVRYGNVDERTVLNPEDDVATVEWGGNWRMPTAAELQELIDNCTWQWVSVNGVGGCRLTSKINGNTIFFPAAGDFYLGTELYNVGLHGGYWTSTVRNDLNSSAYGLIFASTDFIKRDYSRFDGHSVRPVCGDAAPVARYTVSVSSAGNGVCAIKDKDSTSATVLNGSVITVIATPDEGYAFSGWYANDALVSTNAECTFTVSEDVELLAKFGQTVNYNGHEYVDLGLPSGLKWATCNVGASSPEEYGSYYAWGETEEKENYYWSTYKWYNGSETSMTKYCTSSSYGTVDNKTILDPEDDVAHVKWGGSWRMPTLDEQNELLNNCTWDWTTQNGVNGCIVTSKTNGNSIFLPAAGSGGEGYVSGNNGYYWSSSLDSSNSRYACYLSFASSGCSWNDFNRCYGYPVRPVSD